jgi:hypothetical protein
MDRCRLGHRLARLGVSFFTLMSNEWINKPDIRNKNVEVFVHLQSTKKLEAFSKLFIIISVLVILL